LILFAIKSCFAHRDGGFHNPIRNTWGCDVKGDLRFFLGNGSGILLPLRQDEVWLDTPDSYEGLPYKTRTILKWALKRDYSYVFLADTDTFVAVDLLMKSGFENYDYFGVNSKPWDVTFPYHAIDREKKDWYNPQTFPWASGGFGYFLSRRAAELVVAAEPETWAEDIFVGDVMGKHPEMKKGNMPRGISWHYPNVGYGAWQYDPSEQWMEKMYSGQV
jgi:hypothetical protein